MRLMTGVQLSEFILFGTMLFIFRPRKQWPDYFQIGLGGFAANANRPPGEDVNLNNVVQNMVPIFTSTIDNQLLKPKTVSPSDMHNINKSVTSSFGSNDSFRSFGSMGTDEALIIINPCDYTIQDCEKDLSGELDQLPPNPYVEKDDQEDWMKVHIQNRLNLGYRDEH